jgi:tetratricopeptide (TPR) repeat protein
LLEPNDPIAHVNRGVAWLKSQKVDQAIADFNAAIKLDPKDPAAFLNRGTAWLINKEFDKAIADWREAIRLDARASVAGGRGSVLFALIGPPQAADAKGLMSDLNFTRLPVPVQLVAAYLALAGRPRDETWRRPFLRYLPRQIDEAKTYARALAHFAALRGGRKDQARSSLDDLAGRCDRWRWPYPVVQYLRGEIDRAQLLKAADTSGKPTEPLFCLSDSMEFVPSFVWVEVE